MRAKKKIDPMDDFNFANRLPKNMITAEDIQSNVRVIVKQYGWNPQMYPEYTKYAFWTIITGDAWGNFKRLLKKRRKDRSIKVDARDPDVVLYQS